MTIVGCDGVNMNKLERKSLPTLFQKLLLFWESCGWKMWEVSRGDKKGVLLPSVDDSWITSSLEFQESAYLECTCKYFDQVPDYGCAYLIYFKSLTTLLTVFQYSCSFFPLPGPESRWEMETRSRWPLQSVWQLFQSRSPRGKEHFVSKEFFLFKSMRLCMCWRREVATGKERGSTIRPLCVPESLFATLGTGSSIFTAIVSRHNSFLHTMIIVAINNNKNNSNGLFLVTYSVPEAVLWTSIILTYVIL